MIALGSAGRSPADLSSARTLRATAAVGTAAQCCSVSTLVGISIEYTGNISFLCAPENPGAFRTRRLSRLKCSGSLLLCGYVERPKAKKRLSCVIHSAMTRLRPAFPFVSLLGRARGVLESMNELSSSTCSQPAVRSQLFAVCCLQPSVCS
jgi:hypothetical protein